MKLISRIRLTWARMPMWAKVADMVIWATIVVALIVWL